MVDSVASASAPLSGAVRASPFPAAPKASDLDFRRMAGSRSPHPKRLSFVPAFSKTRSAYCAVLLTSPSRSRTLRSAQSGLPDTPEISRGKFDRLPCTPAGFTTPALDDCGLCDQWLARPAA